MAPTLPRRFSEVYVELPLLSPRMSIGSARSKENLPLSPKANAPHAAARLSKPSKEDVLKEKTKDSGSNKNASDKKRKADDDAESGLAKKLKSTDATEDKEYCYCHQCNKRVSVAGALQCTRDIKGKRCRLKYCKACLKNRYGEDHDAIRAAGIDTKLDGAERKKHVSNVHEYLFACPRCQSCCNCSICRKAAGLEATGKISIRSGESARDVLAKNPKATEKTMKPAVNQLAGKAAPAHSGIVPYEDSAPSTKPARKDAPRRAAVLPPKVPAEPEWSEIPTDLSREEVEDRIYLREFILRFGPLMSVTKSHVDALDDFDTLSDATVKAVIVALLDLIAVEDEGPHRKTLQYGVKDARSAHSPTKIWTVLERLRDKGALDIPDPAEPSDGAGSYNTRRGVTVAQGTQLLPILLALCERVLRGATMRSEIEERAREHPQFNRDTLYGPLKEVNDAWTERKKALMEKKSADPAWKATYKKEEAKHREEVADIEQTHYEGQHDYAPRFRALGRDHAGRTYYILSSHKVKKLPSEDEREGFARWAWFVAVYGTAQNEEGWWGFGTPEDVRKLSKWLMALALNDVSRPPTQERDDVAPMSPLSELSDDSDEEMVEKEKLDGPAAQMAKYYGPKGTTPEVKTLCKRLDEFAAFLEWRFAKESK